MELHGEDSPNENIERGGDSYVETNFIGCFCFHVFPVSTGLSGIGPGEEKDESSLCPALHDP
jgi:hypothetical protein